MIQFIKQSVEPPDFLAAVVLQNKRLTHGFPANRF
jgi:hypothetical protein